MPFQAQISSANLSGTRLGLSAPVHPLSCHRRPFLWLSVSHAPASSADPEATSGEQLDFDELSIDVLGLFILGHVQKQCVFLCWLYRGEGGMNMYGSSMKLLRCLNLQKQRCDKTDSPRSPEASGWRDEHVQPGDGRDRWRTRLFISISDGATWWRFIIGAFFFFFAAFDDFWGPSSKNRTLCSFALLTKDHMIDPHRSSTLWHQPVPHNEGNMQKLTPTLTLSLFSSRFVAAL